ncbi:MAG: 5'/3'-nucleotidase SurE [Spirochaetaceae bacterium]|jgi:5'-nucleotidase|nr:5'/3'-nucleotidase SurE [Spirochaetaceae bacterium]
MKILVTNDDGFECEGIIKLGEALKKTGHTIFTVAPDRDRSGSSHSMTITEKIQVKQIARDFWICRGTPVDCVVSVISGGLPFTPDIVVSGINAGPNLGTDIVYSGTASAARQAALSGIPGLAFSLCGQPPFFWDEAARWSAAHLDDLLKLWNKDVFINVNMPNIESIPSGVEIAFPARRAYVEKTEALGGEEDWKVLVMTGFDVETDFEHGSDHHLVSLNKAAVSPVFLHPVIKEGGERA